MKTPLKQLIRYKMLEILSRIVIVCVIFLFLSSCSNRRNDTEKASTKNAVVVPALDLTNFDKTIAPEDDFYNYVNGNWAKTSKIPDDLPTWGGLYTLEKSIDKQLLAILEEMKSSKAFKPNSTEGKVVSMYKSRLDTVRRNKEGINPLKPTLQSLDKVKNLKELQQLIATDPTIHQPFFELLVDTDLNDSNKNILVLTARDFGLPDRDYYLKTENQEILSLYKKYIGDILLIFGNDKEIAKDYATKIVAMETKLAAARFTKEESRDDRNYNNPMTLIQADSLVSQISFIKFLNTYGISNEVNILNVTEPSYFKSLKTFFDEHSIEDIKLLVQWHTINDNLRLLSTELQGLRWSFYGKQLFGLTQQTPIEKRALNFVNNGMGDALGKIYVTRKFSKEAKAEVETLVHNLKTAL